MSKVSDGTWEYTEAGIKLLKSTLSLTGTIPQKKANAVVDERLKAGDTRVLIGTAKAKRKQLGYRKFAEVCFNCRNYQKQSVMLLVNSTTAICPQQCKLGGMPVESNGTCDYWKAKHD